MSWFVYVITENVIHGDEILNKGERGVGRCSMAPGIMDAPHGVMYVIPDHWVAKYHTEHHYRNVCADVVRRAAAAYYGVDI